MATARLSVVGLGARVVGRAQKTGLFAGEKSEDQVVTQVRPPRAQRSCHFEHRGRSRGVVVGAHVRLAALGRERMATSQTQVIVVGPDDHRAPRWLAGCGEPAHHVESRALLHLEGNLHAGGQRPAGQELGHDGLHGGAFHHDHRYARIPGSGGLRLDEGRLGAGLPVGGGGGGRQWPVHNQETDSPSFAREPGLSADVAQPASDRRVAGLLVFRGEAANQHHLSLHVELAVVVNLVFGRDDAVARQHEGPRHLPLGRESERRELGLVDRHAAHGHRRAGLHRDTGHDRKLLLEASLVARGFQPQRAQALRQIGARLLEPLGADPATLPGRIRQPAHVPADAIGRLLGGLVQLGQALPAGHEQVGVAAARRRGPVGRERQRLAVRGKVGETVEARAVGYPPQAAAIRTHGPQVELPALRVTHVRREDDDVLGGMKKRRERGGVQVAHLHGIGPVIFGHPESRAWRVGPALAPAAPGSRPAPFPAAGGWHARRCVSSPG